MYSGFLTKVFRPWGQFQPRVSYREVYKKIPKTAKLWGKVSHNQKNYTLCGSILLRHNSAKVATLRSRSHKKELTTFVPSFLTINLHWLIIYDAP